MPHKKALCLILLINAQIAFLPAPQLDATLYLTHFPLQMFAVVAFAFAAFSRSLAVCPNNNKEILSSINLRIK